MHSNYLHMEEFKKKNHATNEIPNENPLLTISNDATVFICVVQYDCVLKVCLMKAKKKYDDTRNRHNFVPKT